MSEEKQNLTDGKTSNSEATNAAASASDATNATDLAALEAEFSNLTLRALLQRFKPLLLRYKFRFFCALFGMLLAAAAQAESAHIIEPILNKIFTEKQTDLLYILPFGVFALYLAKNIGLFLQSTSMGFIGLDIANRLRKDILARLIAADLAFFRRHSSGELISRSLNDINSLRLILAQFVPDLIREAFTACALVAVVIYQSPKLAFFAFIILPAALVPIKKFSKKMRKIGVASQQNNAQLTSALSEIFANIELIKAANAQEIEQKRFARHSDEISHLAYRGIKIEALSSPTMETFGSLGVAIVLIIGGGEVIAGKMQVGNFFSFLTALFLLYQPIRRISGVWANLQMNLAASARTLALMQLQSKIPNGSLQCGRIGSIEAKNLSLNYGQNGEIKALCGLDFAMQSSKIYALIGRSGSGKSSLINLLLRFYELSGGELKINSQDAAELDVASLREQIALVSQNIYLFAGSVLHNVCYGCAECSHERATAALKAAGALDFVTELGGLEAELAEGGHNLSGGQRQRLALARAFYKDASVLIFDEATSALDNATQQAVISAVAAQKSGKITILIAHRLESLAIADEALLFSGGKIVARGGLKELENDENFKILKGEFNA